MCLQIFKKNFFYRRSSHHTKFYFCTDVPSGVVSLCWNYQENWPSLFVQITASSMELFLVLTEVQGHEPGNPRVWTFWSIGWNCPVVSQQKPVPRWLMCQERSDKRLHLNSSYSYAEKTHRISELAGVSPHILQATERFHLYAIDIFSSAERSSLCRRLQVGHKEHKRWWGHLSLFFSAKRPRFGLLLRHVLTSQLHACCHNKANIFKFEAGCLSHLEYEGTEQPR